MPKFKIIPRVRYVNRRRSHGNHFQLRDSRPAGETDCGANRRIDKLYCQTKVKP
jgi:hypothetical protein